MSQKESREMYLVTIFILQQETTYARAGDVAKRMNVSKPSVTKAMNTLKKQGLVEQEKYGPIALTDEGNALAKQVYDNHNLITEFIVSSLDMPLEQAEKEACKVEHVVSINMIDAIRTYLA